MMMYPQFVSDRVADLLTTADDEDLRQRLELYQVFSKIYERHQGLLHEILDLENPSSRHNGRSNLLHYIQGVITSESAHLVTNFLDERSQVLYQDQQIWTIGRDSHQVAIPIPDKRLSRHHAAIQYRQPEGFYLIDLKSTNGTFVNGERVHHSTRLHDGDRIRLGSLTFIFFVCDARSERQHDIPDEILALVEEQTQHPPSPRRSKPLHTQHAGAATNTDAKTQALHQAAADQSHTAAADAEPDALPVNYAETLHFLRSRLEHPYN
jgi:pSer/pThr/pTyr-binding forkhead associated (FHA) protein